MQEASMEYCSVEEVLQSLQMDEDAVRQAVSEGRLRAYRVDDRMVFRRADVDEFGQAEALAPDTAVPELDFAATEEPDTAIPELDFAPTEPLDLIDPSEAIVVDEPVVEPPEEASDPQEEVPIDAVVEPPDPPVPVEVPTPPAPRPASWAAAPWALAIAGVSLATVGWVLLDLARVETGTGSASSLAAWLREALSIRVACE